MSKSTEELFSKSLYVLDGGFSTQLSEYDNNCDNHPLWCSLLLHKNPELVYKTHLDYLRAGADIIETNTYQASVAGYQKYLEGDLTEKQCRDLISKAVQIAKDAREIYLAEIKDKTFQDLLAPLEPICMTVQSTQGEYISKYSIREIQDWHVPRIETLLTSGVDLLAIETIPVSQEAEMLCELLKSYPQAKAWLSFSCKDGKHLSSGENFQHVAQRCLDLNPDQIVAVGVNCCKPEYVEELLTDFNKNRRGKGAGVPLIVYPNSGETYDKEKGWIDKDKCVPIEVYIKTWIHLGVKFLGGCCKTNTDTIRKIRERVTKHINKPQHT